MKTLEHQENEAITACIYDEQRAGVWLLFTVNEPEFIDNIDRCVYSEILKYMNKYELVRAHFRDIFKKTTKQ